jgi:D-lactate dehydrogenase
MRFLDSIVYLETYILPRAALKQKRAEIVLHPVCSLEKMKAYPTLLHVAHFFAEKVHIPIQSGCCGMAGDRGFTHPELTASATAQVAEEIKAMGCKEAYSSTRTCEMAMSQATGISYQSILYLANECL